LKFIELYTMTVIMIANCNVIPAVTDIGGVVWVVFHGIHAYTKDGMWCTICFIWL